MGKEAGEWIMCGIEDENPDCIHDYRELVKRVNKIGFLPLFQNEIQGFSVEENTNSDYWWTEHETRDPWQWRITAAEKHQLVYGKFFAGKAGFLSKKWLPFFVNYRRDGYDFDTLWEEGKASYRQKKIMDCFLDGRKEILSPALKREAGFVAGGEKNFDGTMSALQEKIYLVTSGFRQRANKRGEPYGWSVALYSRPEDIWGYETVTAVYEEKPEESYEKICRQIRKIYGDISEKKIQAVIGRKP